MRSGSTDYGNGQAAPAGNYYFALPGLSALTQAINRTSAGYMIQLEFSACYSTADGSAPATTPTLQVRTGSPAIIDEVDLSQTFTQFGADFDIYKDEFTLQLTCHAADASVDCLLDAVSLHVVSTCDDVVDEAMVIYSDGAVASCLDAVLSLIHI